MTLTSAGMASLIFSGNTSAPAAIKWMVSLFFLSLLLNFASFSALIEHKNSENDNLEKLSQFAILSGFLCFAVGLYVAVMSVII